MADYCMACGKPSPCADHKIIVESKCEPIKRPHSDSADMRGHQMALYIQGASAQPGSPQFEGGAAYEDYQVHSAPWQDFLDKLHSARVALMAAEATLALCAGKVPPYVEDRRAETVAIVRASLKELGG